MATGDIELYNILHAILMSDSAVAGEGAALGIGLLMIGMLLTRLPYYLSIFLYISVFYRSK